MPGVSKVASYVNQAKVPMPDRMHTYNQLEHFGVGEVLSARFLESVDAQEPRHHRRDTWRLVEADDLVDSMLA